MCVAGRFLEEKSRCEKSARSWEVEEQFEFQADEAGFSARVRPVGLCQLLVASIWMSQIFYLEKTVWRVFSPNHRFFLKKKFYVILLTSKSKLHTSGWLCYPDHITDTIPTVSSVHTTSSRHQAQLGRSEQGFG